MKDVIRPVKTPIIDAELSDILIALRDHERERRYYLADFRHARIMEDIERERSERQPTINVVTMEYNYKTR